MKRKLTTNEAAALAADEFLGASNFGETVAEASGEQGAAKFYASQNKVDVAGQLYAVSRSESFLDIVAFCATPEDAERIAYCLNIVEESEKTDQVA